jgi:hypothetical protein
MCVCGGGGGNISGLQHYPWCCVMCTKYYVCHWLITVHEYSLIEVLGV